MIEHNVHLKGICRLRRDYRRLIRHQWFLMLTGIAVIYATLVALMLAPSPGFWILVLNLFVICFMVELLVRTLFFIERCLIEIETLGWLEKDIKIDMVKRGNSYG